MGKALEERQIYIEDNQLIPQIFGQLDENAKLIKKELGVDLSLRNGNIVVRGE